MPSIASRQQRIMIADDQTDVLEALRFLFKGEGFQTESATSPAAVLQAIEARDFDLLLMDLNYTRDTTSGQEGLDLLTRIRSVDSFVPVVVMTAWGSVELAVEAMRRPCSRCSNCSAGWGLPTPMYSSRASPGRGKRWSPGRCTLSRSAPPGPW
jgi:CheY-like chemotaxis protein